VVAWYAALHRTRDRSPRDGCRRATAHARAAWRAVVPQLWIIQRFVEAPIVFVGRLESYQAGLDELQRRYGVLRPEITSARFQAPTNNKDEGRLVVNRSRLVACAPTAIAKLINHLAPDYECLGYEVPSPPRANAPLPADCAVGNAMRRGYSSASPISCRRMPGGCSGLEARRTREHAQILKRQAGKASSHH